MPIPISPQGVARLLGKSFEDGPLFNGVQIQTHYGNIVLPVAEIWPDRETGMLHISVDIPETHFLCEERAKQTPINQPHPATARR